MYKDSSLLYKYKNGNYTVRIFEDGTKERYTLENEFNPTFPESIDLKITSYCDMNCPMCHEDSNINGKHATLDDDFIETLHEGTELAIGGGNPLSHPELIPFLERLNKKHIICNMTVNETHFLQNKDILIDLMNKKLIRGLGISLNKNDLETFEVAKQYHDIVFHVILGIIDKEKLLSIPSGLKVLLLGYKRYGRGKDFYNDNILKNIKEVEHNFKYIKDHFSTIGFDNLAIDQLRVKYHVPKPLYREFYMGDDGCFTMYIDLVKKEFAISSTSERRFPILQTIEQMFEVVKKESQR